MPDAQVSLNDPQLATPDVNPQTPKPPNLHTPATDCIFSNNAYFNGGGAVKFHDTEGAGYNYFTNCIFRNNTSNSGPLYPPATLPPTATANATATPPTTTATGPD